MHFQSPFSVAPASATLAVNACVQISVDFDPQTVGDHAAELVVHYDTGEQLHGTSSSSSESIYPTHTPSSHPPSSLPPTLPPPFLLPSLHSGETVYTQLHGSANDVNVRLDRSSITLKDTFIGLSSQRSELVCVCTTDSIQPPCFGTDVYLWCPLLLPTSSPTSTSPPSRLLPSLLLLLFPVHFSPRTVMLHNRSGVVVHYQWKAFGSRAEEEMQREM